MDTDIKVRDRSVTTVLSKRRNVRVSEIGGVISTAFGEVYAYLGARQVPATEPPFIIYHGAPGPGDAPFEIEICAPIRRPIDPPAGWQLVELPPGPFASTVHIGPYATLGETYDRLHAWLPAHGYALAGAPREVYLSEPSTPPAETRTVVEFPVARVEAAAPAIS